MNQTLINSAHNNVMNHSGQIFEINKFPKEFKRNWIQTLDVRFISIFLLTFVSAVVLMRYLYFQNILSDNFAPVQQAYIHFFDNRQFYDSIEDIFDNNVNFSASNETEKAIKSEKSTPAVTKPSDVSIPYQRKSQSLNNEFKIGNSEQNAANNQTGTGILNVQASVANSRIQDSLFTATELRMQNALASAERNHVFISESIHASPHYEIRGVKTDNASFKDAIQSIPVGEKTPQSYNSNKDLAKNKKWSDIPSSMPKKSPDNNESLRTEDAISSVIISHNRTIQDCYKQSLKRNPTIKGKITIRFSVSVEGHVKEVKIIKSTLNDDLLEKCIVIRIQKWKDFGAISNGSDEIYYRQTFVFGK